jgi:hypothetical protein
MDNKITYSTNATDLMAKIANKKKEELKAKKDHEVAKKKQRLDAIQPQLNQRSFNEPVRNMNWLSRYGI